MKSVTTKKQVARVHVPAAMPIEMDAGFQFDLDKHSLADTVLLLKQKNLDLQAFLARLLSNRDLGLYCGPKVKVEAERLYMQSLIDSPL